MARVTHFAARGYVSITENVYAHGLTEIVFHRPGAGPVIVSHSLGCAWFVHTRETLARGRKCFTRKQAVGTALAEVQKYPLDVVLKDA